jgi:hypothetical protein
MLVCFGYCGAILIGDLPMDTGKRRIRVPGT